MWSYQPWHVDSKGKERKLIEKNNKLNATSKHLDHNGVVNYVGQTGASGAIELDGD